MKMWIEDDPPAIYMETPVKTDEAPSYEMLKSNQGIGRVILASRY